MWRNNTMNNLIDMSFCEEDAKILIESLKGSLVRENGMNFQYLSKVTSIGLYIENRLREEDVI